MNRLIGCVAWLFACALLCPLTGKAEQAAPAFSAEQLDQLTAPVALYPDTLLSQVLMAATYPADVAEAAKWSQQHPDQTGDDAVKVVGSQPWDPSVKALVAFPQVLAMMGNKPDWVQNLGDAFLASSQSVLDSVQRLRAKAQQAGNLKTNEQQKVVVQQAAATDQAQPQTAAPSQQIIVIEPADPQVVYVPSYNPTVVYGPWPYPAYPPYYYPPPPAYYPGTALASGIAFGVGVGVVASLWSDCDWHHGDVDIDVNRYNNINVNQRLDASRTKFEHNPVNRRGVPYRDARSQQQFSRNLPGAETRANYRGRDPARDAQRQQAQSELSQRGMDPARGREQLRTDPQARERAQSAARNVDNRGVAHERAGAAQRDQNISRARSAEHNRPAPTERDLSRQTARARGSNDNAFSNVNNAQQTRRQIDRGAASRAQMGRPAGGGGRRR